MSMMYLLFFCLVTVVIETGFFWMCGFDSRDEMTVTACTNVVTNLVLNLLLLPHVYRSVPLLLTAELIVVAVEYGIFCVAFGRGWKLLLLTIAANALSFGFGLLI